MTSPTPAQPTQPTMTLEQIAKPDPQAPDVLEISGEIMAATNTPISDAVISLCKLSSSIESRLHQLALHVRRIDSRLTALEAKPAKGGGAVHHISGWRGTHDPILACGNENPAHAGSTDISRVTCPKCRELHASPPAGDDADIQPAPPSNSGYDPVGNGTYANSSSHRLEKPAEAPKPGIYSPERHDGDWIFSHENTGTEFFHIADGKCDFVHSLGERWPQTEESFAAIRRCIDEGKAKRLAPAQDKAFEAIRCDICACMFVGGIRCGRCHNLYCEKCVSSGVCRNCGFAQDKAGKIERVKQREDEWTRSQIHRRIQNLFRQTIRGEDALGEKWDAAILAAVKAIYGIAPEGDLPNGVFPDCPTHVDPPKYISSPSATTDEGKPSEKDRRVYYQSIVYDVCNIIDRHRGDGKKCVCGTVESPSQDVTKTLENLLSNLEPSL